MISRVPVRGDLVGATGEASVTAAEIGVCSLKVEGGALN